MFSIKKATRLGVNPLIGLYSESGCGKTFSSLLLARGLVGAKGKIVLIDTESGRGSLYADEIQGGYDVLTLDPPFSPMRYREAIKEATDAKADCIIVDSVSHEWEGLGGVLDMAHEVEEKSGKPGLHCWKQPKFEHNKLMLSLLQAPVPTIVCLRAHYKTRQIKNSMTGKNEIVKDDKTTPIQSEAFIFEMTVHMEVKQDHSITMTKSSISMKGIFDEGKPITMETGARLAGWCQGCVKVQTPIPQTDDMATLKKRLWAMTEKHHGKDKDKLQSWLTENGFLDSDKAETLADCGATRLADIILQIQAKEGAE